jgi:hypothetical protein
MGCTHSSQIVVDDIEAQARQSLLPNQNHSNLPPHTHTHYLTSPCTPPPFPSLPFSSLSATSHAFDVSAKRTGNDEIEYQLRKDREIQKREVKMLLLGAGESGKVGSTVSLLSPILLSISPLHPLPSFQHSDPVIGQYTHSSLSLSSLVSGGLPS